MSPGFVLGRENVPCVAEVVNRSLKADCTDFKDGLKLVAIVAISDFTKGYLIKQKIIPDSI